MKYETDPTWPIEAHMHRLPEKVAMMEWLRWPDATRGQGRLTPAMNKDDIIPTQVRFRRFSIIPIMTVVGFCAWLLLCLAIAEIFS